MEKSQIIVHVLIRPVENGYVVACDDRHGQSPFMTPEYVALDERTATDRARELLDEKLKAWEKSSLNIMPSEVFPRYDS